jgi:hypothetical protein
MLTTDRDNRPLRAAFFHLDIGLALRDIENSSERLTYLDRSRMTDIVDAVCAKRPNETTCVSGEVAPQSAGIDRQTLARPFDPYSVFCIGTNRILGDFNLQIDVFARREIDWEVEEKPFETLIRPCCENLALARNLAGTRVSHNDLPLSVYQSARERNAYGDRPMLSILIR